MKLIETPVARRRRLRRPSQAAIRRRVEIIADALRLTQNEIDRAMADDDSLIDFAIHYNQSLDWLFLGDPRGMICALCPHPPKSSPPPLRLVHSS